MTATRQAETNRRFDIPRSSTAGPAVSAGHQCRIGRYPPSSNTSTPPWRSQLRPAPGPLRSAAFARISASTAVGAIAVAWTMPVNAGRPVAGSSRWCAGRPAPSSQLRRPMPLVATAAFASSERVERAAVERAGDVDPPRRAADPQVAGAVDGKAVVARELPGQHVGEQALGQPAAVELEARRALDGRPSTASARHGAPGRPGRRPSAAGRAPARRRAGGARRGRRR